MTVITQLPTPPSRAIPNQFSVRGDEFLGALPTFVTETNAVASEVNADRITAVDSAATAVTKAAEATASAGVAAIVGTSTKWVSGTTYTEGQGVWSPIDLLPYRRLTNGAGTTDPSADSTNWKPLPPVPMVRVARTANVEITPADRGHFFDITSGTFSQTFSSKEMLGNGFYCYILNSGTGVVTIDPGGLDYALYQKHSLLIECDGTSLRVVIDSGPRQIRLPIFSPEAAEARPISSMESVDLPAYSTFLTGNTHNVVYGSGVFIASSTTSQANVSSSTDGITWTLRAMPSSGAWSVFPKPSGGFLAVSTGTMVVATSADGITWSASTSLPGNSRPNVSPPVFNGSVGIVSSNTTDTCYLTTDEGVSWTTKTLPTDLKFFSSVGGVFFGIVENTTQAYTSTTGETGSWTVRTLPVSVGLVTSSPSSNGKIRIHSGTKSTKAYESSDGINWTTDDVLSPMDSAGGVYVNGVYLYSYPSSFPFAYTQHGSGFATRTQSVPIYSSFSLHSATNGTILCFPAVGLGVVTIGPNPTAPTAIFEG